MRKFPEFFYAPEGGASGPADSGDAGGGTGASGGDAGAAGGGWFNSLPDNLRSDPGLAKFASAAGPDSIAQAYLNAQKLIGVPADQMVRLDDATLKDPTALLRRLGASEKAEDYTINGPDGKAIESGPDADGVAWLKAVAAETGMLPSQAQKLFDAYMTRTSAVRQEASNATAHAEDTLRREWGPAFGVNIGVARAVAETFGITEHLNSAGLGSNPDVIRALVRMGGYVKGLTDGGVAPAAGGNGTSLRGDAARTAGRDAMSAALDAMAKGDTRAYEAKMAEARNYYKGA